MSKTGVAELKVTTGNHSHARTTPASVSSLLREFEILCQRVGEHGLACCTAAAAVLSTRHPNLHASLLARDTEVPLPEGEAADREKAHARVSVNVNKYDEHGDISVDLRWPSELSCSIEESTSSVRKIKSFHVRLEATLAPVPGRYSRPRDQLLMADELSMLLQMSSIVTSRICSEIAFPSPHAIPQQLAEALLRTVKFASPTVSLQGAKLSLETSEDIASDVTGLAAEAWTEAPIKAVRNTPLNDIMQDTVSRRQAEEVSHTGICRVSNRDPPRDESNVMQDTPDGQASEILNQAEVMRAGKLVRNSQSGPVMTSKHFQVLCNPDTLS